MRKTAKQIFSIPKIQKVGIYAIRNKKTNKYYIGSSVNVYSRMLTHARNIIRFGGINETMAKDINGKRDFKNIEFIVLKTFEDGTITDKQLREEESEMFKKYDSMNNGYNIQYTHGNGKFNPDEKLFCKPITNKSKEQNFDEFVLRLPEGSKEIMDQLHVVNYNAFIYDIVIKELNRIQTLRVIADQAEDNPGE